MASIGGYTQITIRGAVDTGAGENLENITRPHVDGIAFRKIGKRGRPVEVVTVVDVASGSAAKTEFENYEALQGTLITVVDDAANSWANVAVLSVHRAGIRAVTTPVGGVRGGAWLLRCRWTLQHTETS